MATKENPGKFDCYAAAEPDEPMFVLLARDKHAPALVWLWAALRELDDEDVDKVKEAREACVAMMVWAKDHGRGSAGFGQALLAGVLELIRSINHLNALAGTVPPNQETEVDMVRRYLASVNFGMAEDREANPQ